MPFYCYMIWFLWYRITSTTIQSLCLCFFKVVMTIHSCYAPLYLLTLITTQPAWCPGSRPSMRLCTLIVRFMGPTWGPSGGWQDPGGPHVGPMNFPIWVSLLKRITDWDSSECQIMYGCLVFKKTIFLWEYNQQYKMSPKKTHLRMLSVRW